MTPLMFIYNIILIMIYTCTAMLFFIVFTRVHKKSYLAVACLFLFYVMDNAIVYMAEFISSFTSFYNNTLSDGSIYKTIILSAVCFCYLFIKAQLIDEDVPSVHDWAVYGILILWFLIIPEVSFSGNIWFYYIAEPLFLIYLCLSIFFYWIKHRAENPCLSGLLLPYRHLLIVTPFLALGVMVEDAMVLFNLSPLLAMSERIRQRNFIEDIQSLVFVGYAFYAFFLVQKKEKANNEQPPLAEKPETIALSYLPANELDIAGFSKEYSLTKRESQVLKLLLEDKSNQEMQELLVIAPGTVKNHIHNIYQKTCVSKRSQLLMLVSEFTKQESPKKTEGGTV